MDELKNFIEEYSMEKMRNVISSAPLYGYQKEELLTLFGRFLNRVDSAYRYHPDLKN